MFTDKTHTGVIKRYNSNNKSFIGIRINNSRGKRIYSIPSLKFIKVANDSYGFRCCKTYFIGKGEKRRMVYCDIFDDKEYDSMFVDIESLCEFTEVIPEDEIESYSYVLKDEIIKERIDFLNNQVVLKRC